MNPFFKKSKQIPVRYKIRGLDITCLRCGHDRFLERKGQLNTPGMTLLDMDWLNKTASLLICASCSRIEWYADRPMRVE